MVILRWDTLSGQGLAMAIDPGLRPGAAQARRPASGDAALELHVAGLLAHAAQGGGFLQDLLGGAAAEVLAFALAALAGLAAVSPTAADADLRQGFEGLDREGDAPVGLVDLEDLDADDLVGL